MVTQDSGQCITAYNFYKNGVMPRPGGWMDQSAKFIDAVQVIDGEVNAIERERVEKIKAS